jgi:hypothetical protein
VPFSRRQVFDAAMTNLNAIGHAVVDDNEAFVRTVLCRTVASALSMGFVIRTQVISMLGGEVEEGQQCFAILGHAFDRLVVFRLVFLGEDINRYLGQSAAWRQVNFA